MPSPLTIERHDAYTVLTMDDGKVNKLSLDMIGELQAAIDDAADRRLPVVLAGRDGIFSAGFDLSRLRSGGPDAMTMVRAGFELSYRMLSLPVPVVIACTGHAIAMGVFLLLSGDYRVGATGDFRIGANEVAIGITMPDFGLEVCRQRLTPAAFDRAVINAEMFDPEDAVAAGFLDRAVPAAHVTDIATGKAIDLAALDVDVHTRTKLRARAGSLAAIRAAIDGDTGTLGLG